MNTATTDQTPAPEWQDLCALEEIPEGGILTLLQSGQNLLVHRNGALGLTAIHAVADDPKATADALAKEWKAVMEEIFDGCAVVKTGAVELLIWSPAAWQSEYKSVEAMAPAERPAIVGLTVAIERARPLQALLRANNVPFALNEGDRVIVPAEHAGGLAIEFLPQT